MEFQEDIQKLINLRAQEADTLDRLLDVYKNLFDTIWQSIEPILGSVTAAALMQKAIEAAQASHPIVRQLHVTDKQILLSGVWEHTEPTKISEVRSAFDEVIARFLDSVYILTGNILMRRIFEELRRKPS